MKTIKVTFANGDSITTSINGTEEEIRHYYMNQAFNIGTGGEDNVQQAISVEFLA